MILENDQFVLEISFGDFLYFGLKDSQGNEYDSKYTEWDDLVDPESVHELHHLLTSELTKAYKVFEIEKAGNKLTTEIIEGLSKGVSGMSRLIQ